MQAEAYRVNPDMPLFEQSAVQSKMLFIYAVMPIMSIYRLPFGQYEYAGHVINLPQDNVCHLHNIFQQSWMHRLPYGAYVTLVIMWCSSKKFGTVEPK